MPDFPSFSRFHWHEHRRLAIGLLAAALVFSGLLGYEQLKRPADVHNSNVAFKPEKPPKPPKKAKTASCSRSAPAMATCAGPPPWAARSSRRPPSTRGRST